MSQAVLTTTALPAFRPRVRVTALVDRLGIVGMVAAITLGVIVLVATLAPVVAPYDPNEPDLLTCSATRAPHTGSAPTRWAATSCPA